MNKKQKIIRLQWKELIDKTITWRYERDNVNSINLFSDFSRKGIDRCQTEPPAISIPRADVPFTNSKQVNLCYI